MAARGPNPDYMNGIPELLILGLLREGEMYGYEIVRAIRGRTASVIEVGEGVVYPVLHALERKKALTSRRRSVNGRSRVYYSVTAAGSLRYAERLGAWSGLAGAVRGLLLGGKHA